MGDLLAVLLLLAIMAGVGWQWWQQHHSLKSSPKIIRAGSASVTSAPVHVVVPSFVVVKRTPATPAEDNTNKPAPIESVMVSNPHPLVPAAPLTPPPPPEKPVNAPVTVENPLPGPAVLPEYPRPAKNMLEAQVALARQAISPGSIDGVIGSQTRAALAVFQRLHGLPATRVLDTNTQSSLMLQGPLLTSYVVAASDLARLQPLGNSWLAKSRQSALEYETILELVAEKAHSHPALVQQLNPGVDWTKVTAGTVLKIPDVAYPEPADKAAFVTIHLADRDLEAFGMESNLLAHFPCSIAAKVDKRPVGELHVTAIVPNPDYTFDPAIFADSPGAQAIGHKLVLPPGPNNPVGVAWIGLDKPGYGMHGTPSPEQIGLTESHGCFRLANWDAAQLVKLVWIGLPVRVLP